MIKGKIYALETIYNVTQDINAVLRHASNKPWFNYSPHASKRAEYEQPTTTEKAHTEKENKQINRLDLLGVKIKKAEPCQSPSSEKMR